MKQAEIKELRNEQDFKNFYLNDASATLCEECSNSNQMACPLLHRNYVCLCFTFNLKGRLADTPYCFSDYFIGVATTLE